MTSLTQLSQAIHDAPRWHQQDQFQNTDEIKIVPQADQALGAVVYGLDARKAQSGETILRLKQALAEHLILIFKNQSLDDLQYLAFATYFGSIFRPDADTPVLASKTDTGTPPDVVPVSNAVGQGITPVMVNLHRMPITSGHRHLLLALYSMPLNCQKTVARRPGSIPSRLMKP